MISHVPPALKQRIAREFEFSPGRIGYYPPTGLTSQAEMTKLLGEFKLPIITYWRSAVETAPERRNQARARSAEGPLLADIRANNPDYPPEFLKANYIPVDLSFEIQMFASNTPEVDDAIRAWENWRFPPQGQSPSLVMELQVEGYSRPLVVSNHISFEDPLDNSQIDFDAQGILYRWTFPLRVHSWVVHFGRVKSILKLNARFYQGLDEAATLLDSFSVT